MDNMVDLDRLLETARRNAVFILLMGFIFGIAAFGVAKFGMQREYSASASLLVNRKQDSQQTGGAQFADQQADVQIINTYKDIITRPIILGTVVDHLTRSHKEETKPAVPAEFKTNAQGQQVQTKSEQPAEYTFVKAKYGDKRLTTEKVAKMISISNQANSQVFSVNVKADDPRLARDIANEISDVFKNKVASIMAVSNVSIISAASLNETPVFPNVHLLTIAGVVIGAVIGFAWGFIKEVTDRTVKDLEFLTEELQLTNLGNVSHIGKMRDVKDVINTDKSGIQVSESRISRKQRRV